MDWISPDWPAYKIYLSNLLMSHSSFIWIKYGCCFYICTCCQPIRITHVLCVSNVQRPLHTHSECTSAINAIRSNRRSSSVLEGRFSTIFNANSHWLEVEVLTSVAAVNERDFRRRSLHLLCRCFHFHKHSNVEIDRNRYQWNNEPGRMIHSLVTSSTSTSYVSHEASFIKVASKDTIMPVVELQ